MNRLTFLISLLMPLILFAHGEDEYGPHGGLIRMPGAFHTELVYNGKNRMRVYLLDIDWKNPSVLNSSLEVRIQSDKKTKANCQLQLNYYECSFAKTVNLNAKGQILVLASRENQKGSEVEYQLPLQKLKKKKTNK